MAYKTKKWFAVEVGEPHAIVFWLSLTGHLVARLCICELSVWCIDRTPALHWGAIPDCELHWLARV